MNPGRRPEDAPAVQAAPRSALCALLRHGGTGSRPPLGIRMTDSRLGQSAVGFVIFPAEWLLKLEAQRAGSNLTSPMHYSASFSPLSLYTYVSVWLFILPALSTQPSSSLSSPPFFLHLSRLLSFCSVRQDSAESHVVVIPGCEGAYVDDSLPYVAKVGVSRKAC